MKTNWKVRNATKVDKMLEKAGDDFRELHTKLIALAYLANSNNDPKLAQKIQSLQTLVREALGIIRD